jgi:uncharacterized protein
VKFVDVSRVRSRFLESLTARDGTELSVDVYLPPDEGRYPALVTRTPYDNNRLKRSVTGTTLLPSPADRCKKLAAHGFVVVACDVRGRGDSGGTFVPFAHEAADGADTVEWARALPECDGRVGLFGSGYAGFTALAAAADAAAAWSPFRPDGTPFRGGALRLDWLLWMHLVAGRTIQQVDVVPWLDVFRHRPLATMHEALGRDDIWWSQWLTDPPQLERHVPAAPTLLVTGWWDSAADATLRYWDALSGEDHALVVGPWDDEATRAPRADVGGVAWGPSAAIDPDELLLEWFSAHLRGGGTPRRGEHLFVTGRNEWTEGTALRPVPMNLWLASGGRANTRRGDGRLAQAAPADAPPDRFVHNPELPVLWQPDGGSLSRTAGERLTLDTAWATARDDVLVYEGEPAASSVLIRGRPVARLWVESDADDADWVVALEDVFPGGGRSVHLAHGIVRRTAREPVEVEIELGPVAHELLPGHSLRLLVASSMWPVYAANLGGGDYLHDTEPLLSQHAIHHDGARPSRIELPIAGTREEEPCDMR